MNKIIFTVLLLVLFPITVSANFGQGTNFNTSITPEDITFESLVGISGAVFLKLAGIVALAIAAFKKRLPKVISGGWKTHVLTVLVSFALCTSLLTGWPTIFTCTVLLWLVPAGSISMIKETWEGINKGKLENINLKVK